MFWIEPDLHGCTEEKVIQMSEKDSVSYYEEVFLYFQNEILPLPFIH
ncbi:hypothetical protein CMALT394_290006 [Carnobacterium maltaromaticum]|nr:hypothetical protein CMALT394_290006 [Carnobacterium maltaromaticum]